MLFINIYRPPNNQGGGEKLFLVCSGSIFKTTVMILVMI
jgi:hypothetical protein